jgi:hypothetical protein
MPLAALVALARLLLEAVKFSGEISGQKNGCFWYI